MMWHYTCSHTRAKLGDRGELLPLDQLVTLSGEPLPTARYVWLTDLSVPIPDALGLTRDLLQCDRTEHRYRVAGPAVIVPWLAVRHSWPPLWRELLELAPGARPAHWYVSERAVPVELDPVGARDG